MEKLLPRLNIGKLCIDSGAFSVYNSGKTVDLESFIDFCRDHPADDIFGLDVVADASGTRRNLGRMWSAGIPAIPVWRIGESWEQLEWCTSNASKIAFARTGSSEQLASSGWTTEQWLRQAMARVWPRKVHGLAMASKQMLGLLPWHSVDATSWVFAPMATGNWAGFTGAQVRLKARGVRDVRIEIAEHAKRDRWAAQQWAAQMRELEAT